MKIQDAMKNVRKLGVETAPYIYYVENHPVYADKVDSVFQIVEAKVVEIHTSVITLTEILMKPIQANNQSLIDTYRELLTGTDFIHLTAITPEIAERAAHLRARYNIRTPDALHIAAAITAECNAFLTNDLALKRVTEIRVIVLDNLE
ncbi:MAG: type II toxin-antitoxin system VapC family toxin [Anaerolineae bacterium]|nr:type II toxin-antitoxin system VapC family toxin [Anaerolineae bacterium]